MADDIGVRTCCFHVQQQTASCEVSLAGWIPYRFHLSCSLLASASCGLLARLFAAAFLKVCTIQQHIASEMTAENVEAFGRVMPLLHSMLPGWYRWYVKWRTARNQGKLEQLAIRYGVYNYLLSTSQKLFFLLAILCALVVVFIWVLVPSVVHLFCATHG